MTRTELKTMFPLTVMVTQEILETAEVYQENLCIGALALKSAIPAEFHDSIAWGDFFGVIAGDVVDGIEAIRLTTEEFISVMDIEEPKDITFIINRDGEQ